MNFTDRGSRGLDSLLQILEVRLQQMETRGQVLPAAIVFLMVALRPPPQAQDSGDQPDRQNDYDGDQGEREEDAESFHDGVREQSSAEGAQCEPQAF